MLSKKIRLNTAIFDKVFKTGAIYQAPVFWLRTLPSNASCSRFAVVVPKSVAKTAVLRNKIKRMVYLALESSLLKKSPSFTLNIIGLKKNISSLSRLEIVKFLDELGLKKAQK